MTIARDEALGTMDGVRPTVDEAVWVQTDPGFWAGTTRGDFVGTIELHGGVYLARGTRGQPEGMHTTWASARDHLANSH